MAPIILVRASPFETAESTTLALSIPRIQPHKGIVRSISSAAKDRISGPDVEHANRQGLTGEAKAHQPCYGSQP